MSPEERAASVYTLADLLVSKQAQILEANAKDLADGTKAGLAKPLLSRLSLTSAKLKNLSIGLKQIADSSHQVREYNNGWRGGEVKNREKHSKTHSLIAFVTL